MFDVSPGFNQTKIKINNEIIMMIDENNVDVKIIKVPKWNVRIIRQTMETMIEFNNP